MIEPLHVATVGGQQLRFFRTPLNDGRPDLPWHSVDDLYRCLGLHRAKRKWLLNRMRTSKAAGMQTIATADGIVTVAPHGHAQGAIGAAIACGECSAEIDIQYHLAGTEALSKLMPGYLEFPDEGWMAWMQAAMTRWEDAP